MVGADLRRPRRVPADLPRPAGYGTHARGRTAREQRRRRERPARPPGRIAFDEPFLVVGHSYGAYLARAIVAGRRDRAVGLAIFCPVGESSRELPAHEVVHTEAETYDVLPADQVDPFDEYFVVRTPAMAQRYLDAVAPGIALADETGLERIFAQWTFRRRPEDGGPYPHPTLILAGRQDSTAGYASAGDLVPDYPHATYAVIDGAGHALPHEQAHLVASFIDDWLIRTRGARSGSIGG